MLEKENENAPQKCRAQKVLQYRFEENNLIYFFALLYQVTK